MWIQTVLHDIGDLARITAQGRYDGYVALICRIPWDGYDYGVCILGVVMRYGINATDIGPYKVDSGNIEKWWNTPP